MDPQPDDLFRPMAGLLEDWLRGARLREIVHLIHLIRVELTRRGTTLTYSINQVGELGRAEKEDGEA